MAKLTEKQIKAAKEIKRIGDWPTYVDGRTRRSMAVRGMISGEFVRVPHERWVVKLTSKGDALLAASLQN
jgi:hypothetical protein